MPTERGLQLQNLMAQLPVANQRVVNGLQEGQRTKMAASLVPPGGQLPNGAGPGFTPGMNQIAEAGAQTTADQGKTALQGQANTTQQMGQLQGQAIQNQATQGSAQNADLEQGASQEARRQAQLLNSIDTNLKGKLVDEQMQFDKDQAGNVLFNTRQLTDYAAVNARSEQDFRDKEQIIQQASDRKIAVMKRANDMLQQTLSEGYLKNKQILDNKLKQDIIERQHAIQLQIQAEENKAASRRMMGAGIGTIVGLGVGAAISPAAAPLGSSIGGAIGSALSN